MNEQKLEKLREHYDHTDVSELMETGTPMDLGVTAGTETMSAFTVRLPNPVLEAVREIARRDNCTTGAAMRAIIERGVAEAKSDDAVVSVGELRRLISTARGA